MANKKLKSLSHVLKVHYALMFIFLMLVIVFALGTAFTFYFIQDEPVYYIALGALGAASIAAFVYFLIASAKLYKLVYKHGLKISSNNFEALANYQKEYKLLPDEEISEYKRLNDAFEELSKNIDARVLVSSALHYHGIALQYLSVDHIEVTENSLRENLTRLILASESYRNALIEIKYDLGEEDITENNKKEIVGLIKLLHYKNMLIAKKNDNQGFYVFVPAFDSITQLEEELQMMIRNISLVHHPFTGRKIVLAKVGAVIYPFSDVDNMFSDLEIAMNKEEKLFIYLPEGNERNAKKKDMSALNMNNVSALLEELASMDTHPSKYSENLDHIYGVISKLSNYGGFSVSGYIVYNEEKDGYFPRFRHSDRKDDFVFADNLDVDKNFIEMLKSVEDKDHSYFFRNRQHVNNDFGRYLDYYRISSGLFYDVQINGETNGILYFVNKGEEVYFDSFMKEALVLSCHLISSILKEMDDRHFISVTSRRYRNLMKIAGINIYSIDKSSYLLSMVSDAVKRLSLGIEPGQLCYKALYGLDAPCKDCPLKSNKHKNVKIKDIKYECYPILKNEQDELATLILKPNKTERSLERFDDELLLPTFYAFHESLTNQYVLSREGNILLINIRNVEDIVKKGGNDLYNKSVIALNTLIYDKYKAKLDVYLYNQRTLAVLYPRSSEEDIISLAEFISGGLKDISSQLEGVELNIAYLDKIYSPDISKEEVFSNLENNVNEVSTYNKDQICFLDSNYRRNASHEGYIFDITEEAFNKKTYSFAFQPILDNKERNVLGTELLLRLTDPYTKLPLDPKQVADICGSRGYLPKVYDETLNYLDKLFKKMGYTFFMTSGLTHLSINVDHSFFNDDSLIEKAKSILEKNNLPKGFISLEIDEIDVSEHKEVFEASNKKANEAGLMVLVDKYAADKLTPSEVKSLSFDGIKVTRELVNRINFKEQREKVLSIWQDAHKANLNIGFVGVENRIISEAIHLEDYDCLVQGNFFFSPLSEDDTFEAIRQRNMKDKEMDN